MGFAAFHSLTSLVLALCFMSLPVFADQKEATLLKALMEVSDQKEARDLIFDFMGADESDEQLSDLQLRLLYSLLAFESADDFATLSPGASRALLEALGLPPAVLASLFELYDWNELDRIEHLTNHKNFWKEWKGILADPNPLQRFLLGTTLITVAGALSFPFSFSWIKQYPHLSLPLYILALSGWGGYSFFHARKYRDNLELRRHTTRVVNRIAEEQGYPKPFYTFTPGDSLLALLRACYRSKP